MRYELHGGELAVFFSQDEMNVALSYENAMHRGRGMSSGELMYPCLVDAINERTGVPVPEWRGKDTNIDRPVRAYPEAVESRDGTLIVMTRDGRSVTL